MFNFNSWSLVAVVWKKMLFPIGSFNKSWGFVFIWKRKGRSILFILACNGISSQASSISFGQVSQKG